MVIVKHTNPCGLASHDDLVEAYRRAFAGDPVSAFGGIVALNRRLTLPMAKEISEIFYEIVIAPEYDDDALALLRKKKDLRIMLRRLLLTAGREHGLPPRGRWAAGADPDDIAGRPGGGESRHASGRRPPKRSPTRALPGASSSTSSPTPSSLPRTSTLVGMGAGQPNRVTSVMLAARAAGDKAKGAVMASDAFFPFPDGVETAAAAGITAVIQPGGSIRDKEAIAAADAHGMAMVFTGIRHFKH